MYCAGTAYCLDNASCESIFFERVSHIRTMIYNYGVVAEQV